MRRHHGNQIVGVILLLLAFLIFMPAFSAMAQSKGNDQSGMPAVRLAAEEVDAHVAGMTDEQIRQAYALSLKQESEGGVAATPEAGGKGTWQDVSAQFYGAARAAKAILERAGGFFTGEQKNAGQWNEAVAKLTDGKGGMYLLMTLAGLIAIIVLGLAVRWLFRRTTTDIRQNILNAVRLGKLQFLGRVLSRMLLDAMGVGVYIVVTFILFVLFLREGTPAYIITSVYLIISYYVIVLAFGARVIFSPQAASLRLFPMEDRDAKFLYQWIIGIIFIAGIFAGVSSVFRLFGVNQQLYLLMYSSSGVVVILAMVIMVWQSRRRVAQAIWTEDMDGGDRRRFAAGGFCPQLALFRHPLRTGGWRNLDGQGLERRRCDGVEPDSQLVSDSNRHRRRPVGPALAENRLGRSARNHRFER